MPVSILGENVKALSEHYGLSYREIARRAGIPNAILSNVARGSSRPRESSIAKIAAVFNLDPWDLQTKRLNFGEQTKPEEDHPLKPAVPQGHITPDVLLDDRARALAWEAVCNSSDEELREDPELTMYMPADDLAPGVPRGALLYLTVEISPRMPRLADHVFAVGTAKGLDGNPALVFGTPTISLGQISVRTTSGAVVPVTGIVAYVDGWAVFKRPRPHLPPP